MYRIVLAKERDRFALLTKAGGWVHIPFTTNGMEVLRQILIGDAIARDNKSSERGVGTISSPPQDAVQHMLKALAGCDVPVQRLGPFGRVRKEVAPEGIELSDLGDDAFWDSIAEETDRAAKGKRDGA